MRGVSAPANDSGDSAKSQDPSSDPRCARATFSRSTGEGCALAILVIGVESGRLPPSPACGRRWRGATDEGCLRPGARLRRVNPVARPLIRPSLTRGPPSPVPREKGAPLRFWLLELNGSASLLLPPAGERSAERRMRGVSAPVHDSGDSTQSQVPSSDPR